MKTLKVSEFEWNTQCPKCKKYIGLASTYPIKDDDVVICEYCKEGYKIKLE